MRGLRYRLEARLHAVGRVPQESLPGRAAPPRGQDVAEWGAWRAAAGYHHPAEPDGQTRLRR